jgi:hypothetical protein
VVRPAAICRRPRSRAARLSYQGLMAPAITAAMNRAAAKGSTMRANRVSAMTVRTSSVQRAACGLRTGRTWPWSSEAGPLVSFRAALVMGMCRA